MQFRPHQGDLSIKKFHKKDHTLLQCNIKAEKNLDRKIKALQLSTDTM